MGECLLDIIYGIAYRNNIFKEKFDTKIALVFYIKKDVPAELMYVSLADDNQRLGFVGGGFELVRKGDNDWTLRFKGGDVPVSGGKGFRQHYNVRMELWPEGSYQLNKDGTAVLDVTGRPKPLGTRNGFNMFMARSRPAITNVRVNVR